MKAGEQEAPLTEYEHMKIQLLRTLKFWAVVASCIYGALFVVIFFDAVAHGVRKLWF